MPGLVGFAPTAAGVGVLAERSSQASQLTGDEDTVYVTDSAGTFEIDVSLPQVERLFINNRVSGNFSEVPRLRELFAQGARDFTGLTPEVEKLALGWGIATVPASQTLRKLRADTLDDLDLARFPNLKWLEICPGRAVAAELRAVERLERLELNLGVASLARLSLVGAKDRLEDLRVRGGLGSVEGVERFGLLWTAEFIRTRVRDFSPLANTLVEELRIEHRKPVENGFLGLGEMPELRTLHLEVDSGTLERVADLHRAPALESVTFEGTALGNAVIDSLAQIPTLKEVVMAGGTKTQRARLEAARPDITIFGGVRDAPPGPFEIDQFDDEWSIYGNVASLVGASSNYAAERKIKAALDPSVRKQLSFDTEAGMFSAQSTDRAVIDAVAETIERLGRDQR